MIDAELLLKAEPLLCKWFKCDKILFEVCNYLEDEYSVVLHKMKYTNGKGSYAGQPAMWEEKDLRKLIEA